MWWSCLVYKLFDACLRIDLLERSSSGALKTVNTWRPQSNPIKQKHPQEPINCDMQLQRFKRPYLAYWLGRWGVWMERGPIIACQNHKRWKRSPEKCTERRQKDKNSTTAFQLYITITIAHGVHPKGLQQFLNVVSMINECSAVLFSGILFKKQYFVRSWYTKYRVSVRMGGWWSAAAKRSMQNRWWLSVVGNSTRASNAGKLMRAGAAAARIPPCPQCSVRCDWIAWALACRGDSVVFAAAAPCSGDLCRIGHRLVCGTQCLAVDVGGLGQTLRLTQ